MINFTPSRAQKQDIYNSEDQRESSLWLQTYRNIEKKSTFRKKLQTFKSVWKKMQKLQVFKIILQKYQCFD